MSLKPEGYISRLIDPVIDLHMQAFGAVEVMGTMWSGKTWTSLAHAASVSELGNSAIREIAEVSLDTALDGELPRAIDEWQEVPQVWDAVRTRIDDVGGRRGMYILTGSSSPAKEKVRHTGSGRISRLRMWPMSLAESGHSTKKVSLRGLFDNEFVQTEASSSLRDIATVICRGGWPAALDMEDVAASLIPNQYVDALVSAHDDDAPESEFDQLHFLRSLARNIGSAVTVDTLAKDMGYTTDGRVKEAGRKRIRALLNYFREKYVIDALFGWDAPIKSPQRLRVKPRYDFADPSLAAALLGVGPSVLLENAQLFGQLFEQLCLRDLRVYTSCMKEAAPDSLRYYRDADGLEVDAIIQLRDGRWGAIEIKLGSNKVLEAQNALLRLKNKISLNSAARNPEPSFMMILKGEGNGAYRMPTGIYVVPITELCA